MKRFIGIMAAAAAALWQFGAYALELPPLFRDHAVLQRDKIIPVWGKAEPGTTVKVQLNGHTARTLANLEGNFSAYLPAQTAGGPFELTVTEVESGKTITSKDIYIGEVWLAGGQSNMAWALKQVKSVDTGKIDLPLIRFFAVPLTTQPGKLTEAQGEWKQANPENSPAFSAVAFFFAQKMQQELGVPVGIISSNWGGTIAEAWTSRATLMQDPKYRETMQNELLNKMNAESWWSSYGDKYLHDWFVFDHNKMIAVMSAQQEPDPEMSDTTKEFYQQQADELKALADKLADNVGEKEEWGSPDYNAAQWDNATLPAIWANIGEQYNINGVVWFRKEINIAPEDAGKDIVLHLGAIDKNDITYFNMVKVGQTGNNFDENVWNVPRTYSVPGKLVKPGKNIIAVRNVSHMFAGGMTGPADAMFVQTASQKIPLSGTWQCKIEQNAGLRKSPVNQPGTMYVYSILYHNMIEPLIPYAIRGVIWYQGEANEWRAGEYAHLMELLINDWRYNFQQGEIPFLQVQLANFQEPAEYQDNSTWARIREAQFQAAKATGNLIATAVDLGEAGNIHPARKQEVGERLANCALKQVFNKDVQAMGPVAEKFEVKDGKIIVTFANADDGLVLSKGDSIQTMMIAGEDKVFKPAKTTIEGNTVTVWSEEVPNPCAVRYAWAQNPEAANLYNKAKLPAFPFRSDNW